MKQALHLQQTGKAHLVPIIVRPIDWEHTELAHLSVLPENTIPITIWSDQDEAFQSVVQDLYIMIEKFYPRTVLPVKHVIFPNKHYTSSPQKRHRQKLLDQVHRVWIAGVLHNLLTERPFIPLTMRSQPELVDNPLQHIVQESIRSPQTFPFGTSIHQIYDEANGDLLILGEPGSGKTTLLLTLASTLLTRARRDEDAPIPVVFNLSEWGRQQKPLTQWIEAELHEKYKVSPTEGKTWVDQDRLILLLDGLDEVFHKQQRACLDAIQKFRDLHSFTSIVLCSRLREYYNLTQNRHRLQLQNAVVIQPLSHAQIDAYLTSQGSAQLTLQDAIHTDETIQKLAETPLLLALLARTYASATDIPSFSGEQKTALIRLYIQHMLKRRGQVTQYSEEQICTYLEHLAQHMHYQNQTEFYIEQMQPVWLSSFDLFKRYRFLVNRCLDGIIVFSIWLVCLILAIPFNFTKSNYHIPFIQQCVASLSTSIEIIMFLFLVLAIFIIVMFLAAALGVGDGELYHVIKGSFTRWWEGRFEGRRIELVETIVWPHQLLQPHRILQLATQWFLFLVGLALCFGGFVGIISGSEAGPDAVFTQQCQQLGGQIQTIVADTNTLLDCNPAPNASDEEIRKIHNLGHELFDITYAINWGLTGSIVGASYGFAVSPLIGLGFFWFSQVTWRVRDRRSMIKPAKGVKLTFQNSILLGLMSWLTFVMSYGLGGGLIIEHFTAIKNVVYESLFLSILGGFVFALVIWLRFGGLAIIQHLTMRFLLSQARIIPWRYAHFLDFTAERLLLRKVGNGYMFYHQMLLDYFAQHSTNSSSHDSDTHIDGQKICIDGDQ